MRKKALAFAAAACSLSLALAGCGAGSSASGNEGIINAYGCEPQKTFIPANINENCGGNPVDLMFAKLVTFDEKGNPKNEVADSITPNDDSTQFTIKIKDGWKFTDGTPVTAESFTKAWSYSANATNAMINSSFFSVIKGYDKLQEKGAASDAQLEGLKVVDDKTFTVELNQPSSTFPIRVSYTAFAPLPESFYKDPKAFGENPVGNGPYKFAEWNHNQNIKLVANDDYKGANAPKNKGINFKIYTDITAAYPDVQAGNLDVLETVPTAFRQSFEKDDKVQAYNEAGSVFQSFTFPSTLKHFGNDEEGHLRRQAISRAIDRDAIIDKVLFGIGTAATDFTAPPIVGYSKDIPGSEVLKYDADEAKKLWDQANAISPWTDEDSITFAYNADGGAKDVYDAVANSIKNTLGIKAGTNPYPTFSEFREAISNRSIGSAFRTGWQADYPAAENYLQPLYASVSADGNGSNDGDYKNPEFDKLIDEAAAASSDEEATKLYQKAEQILFNDLPAVPLYYSNAAGVAAKGVKGFVLNWKNVPVYNQLTK